jgi:hypothetical protein
LTGGWEKLYKKEDQKLEKKSQQYYLYSECRSCFSFFVKIYLLFFRRKKKKNMVASFAASSGTKNQQPAAVLPYYEYISHTL